MAPTVGIHFKPLKQFPFNIQRYETILRYNGINSIRLCSSDVDFWQKIQEIDYFIYLWGPWDAERQNAKAILPIIEKELGIPCFPNQKTCWAYDDKIREYFLMKVHGFPMAESWIFWEMQNALDWAENAELPVVFKLSGGAGSANVVLIKRKKDLHKVIKLMFTRGIPDNAIPLPDSLGASLSYRIKRKFVIFRNKLAKREMPFSFRLPNWLLHKNYVFFQEYLPGNSYDTRVTTIGDRAFAFRRFNRKGDFRSSGSGIIDYDITKIDKNFIKLAFEISSFFNFQSMAYDFLYGPNGERKFCEMSYTYVDRAIYNCPGYWDKNLDWHEGHFWPQYFHLMDLLNLPDLVQPNITS